MKEITFSWQLTQGLTKCSAAGKVSSNIFHLNTACGFYYFNTPLIESALLKMWLKVERSSLQFTNCNLLRAKRKEKWTFWGSPFSNTIWLVYVIFRWPDQCPSTQNLLCNIPYNFGFKIQPVDRIFFASRKNVLERRVHQKLAFLTHLIANAWI